MSFSNQESVAQQPSSRRAEMVNLPASYATYVNRWAIVVGISKYQHERLNLKYADRDAESLYELLLTPSGGGFERDHIVKLINEEASTANITRALRSFLKKPAKEDIVLIYFACHGAPDIDRPGIVYLLTHDVDPTDISGTALPMREIDLSLKENLLAERVIILADTCHSAAIGGGIGTRDVGDNSAVVNSYLQEVSKTRGGLALLTSAEANEVSFEDAKWGGGHGVFTHYLLEGMRGAADRSPKNGVVTVGELFEYVRENVQRATGNQQHPCVGTNSYDRNLPIAITAGISAQEHDELGRQLYQIALKLDDKYCFESASRHLREAIRQAAIVGGKLPEAHLQLGLALTATGNSPEEAIAAFDKAINAGIPDADYYLGIAYLKQGKTEASRQHLKAFLEKQPESDKADAVRELISYDASNLSGSESVNRFALLIGINYSSLQDPLFKPLKGPVNDVEMLNGVLSEKYKFRTKMLSDMEATYENIIKSFNELQEITSPRDVIVIYYSGHGDGDNWIPADTKLSDDGERLNIIGSNLLYSLIDAIPALQKYLIIDANFGPAFEGFVERLKQTKICSLFSSSSIGQYAYEVHIEDTQKRHGYFTYRLVQELQQASNKIWRRDLFVSIQKAVQSKFPQQTPFFIGSLNESLFFANLEHCPDLFTFSQRRCYSSFDDQSLKRLHQKVEKQFNAVFPDFYYSLGLAFLERGNYADALTALETAVEYAKQDIEEKLSALGIAQFKNQLYNNASQVFQRWLDTVNLDASNDLPKNLISAVDQLAKSKLCALIVGIETYPNVEIIPTKGLAEMLSVPASLIRKVYFFKKELNAEEIELVNQDLIDQQNSTFNTVQKILAQNRWLLEVQDARKADYFVEIGTSGTYDIYNATKTPYLNLQSVAKPHALDAAQIIEQKLTHLAKHEAIINLYNELLTSRSDFALQDVLTSKFGFQDWYVEELLRATKKENRRINILTDFRRLINFTATNDALSFQHILVNDLGFQAENVKMLLDQDATCQNLLTAFRELTDNSQMNPAVFYFAGLGSVDVQDNPTVLAYDSRGKSTPDILLTELAQLANQCEVNLVSIVDSSWTDGGARYVKCDGTVFPSTRGAKIIPAPIARVNSKIPEIGYASIYPESIRYQGRKQLKQELTFELISFLLGIQVTELTTNQVLKDFCYARKIHFAGNADVLEQTIFSNAVLRSKVQNSFMKIAEEPVRCAVLILRRLIEQRNGAAPEELFNLGIIYYRLNEYDRSITALQTAIDQVSGQNDATGGRQTTSQQSYPEAHYWLGRVLYESNRDPARAVSELRLATQQDSNNSAAHYYLGKALRALVEQEILTEAERAFQAYLNAGAPLGQQEEVQEFFKLRRASKTS